jgi:circadian clock protein KaiC
MADVGQVGSWQVERVPTGVPGLDRLIDGGLTKGGMALIAGGPGAGKSVLAEQIAFHWAAQGRKVLWVVTPGESNEKLLTHLSQMRFYDSQLVGTTVQLVNLSRYLEQGLEAQLDVIRQTVQGGGYGFVVIDGFQTLRAFLGGERETRRLLSELSSELALMGTTLILTVDADPGRYWEAAEVTIADTIISLDRITVDGCERRRLTVLKQRGRPSIGGAHTFSIDAGGVHVYPQLESVVRAPEAPATSARQAFGLPGLDQMLAGGLLEGSATLLSGSPGTGKTVLACQFLAEGLRQGQPVLYLGFFESLNRLLQRGDAFGMPLRQGHEAGRLQVRVYPAGRCDPDACAHRAIAAIEEHKVRRLVLDGLDPLERELAPSGRLVDYLAALLDQMGAHGVTTIVTSELRDGGSLARPLVGQVVGNAILLRFSQVGTRRRRLLSVVKTRYSDHSDAIGELFLSDGRLEVITDPAVVRPEAPELVPVAFRGEPQGGHYRDGPG